MIPWNEYEGYREVTAYPATFDAKRFGRDALRDAATKAMVMFRGWPFIAVLDKSKVTDGTLVVGDGIETTIDRNRMGGNLHFEFWRLRQSGLFFHKSLMDEETYEAALKRGKMLDYTATVYHVSEAIGSLWRLYEALGVPDDEVINIEFRYTGMDGRHLGTWEPRDLFFSKEYICRSSAVDQRKAMSLGLWRAADAEHATDVCLQIFHEMQWLDADRDQIVRACREYLSEIRFSS